MDVAGAAVDRVLKEGVEIHAARQGIGSFRQTVYLD
jgi:hypothetical protein